MMLVLSVFAAESFAGMCTRSAEFYLECLEGMHVEDSACQSESICFDCLGVPMKHQQRWGNATERKYLFAMRELPYRDRLISLATTYLADPAVRKSAVDVLAFQGVREADDMDIFKELIRHNRSPYTLWYALAALQDPRTIPFAEDKYMAIMGSAESLDAKTRNTLMEIIDCLYHFRTKESRELLASLAAEETDEQLKGYIVRTAGI